MKIFLLMCIFLCACGNTIPPNSIYQKGDIVYTIDQFADYAGKHDAHGNFIWVLRKKDSKFILCNYFNTKENQILEFPYVQKDNKYVDDNGGDTYNIELNNNSIVLNTHPDWTSYHIASIKNY